MTVTVFFYVFLSDVLVNKFTGNKMQGVRQKRMEKMRKLHVFTLKSVSLAETLAVLSYKY